MDTVLEAADLTKRYEDFSLRGVSLTVRGAPSRESSAPTQPASPRCCGCWPARRRAAGTLRVLGGRSAARSGTSRTASGMCPRSRPSSRIRTVEWHARFAAPCFARWDGAGFYRLLEDFRVNPLKKVTQLSGGQELLSLALAFSHGAELLILDEPTAGLDIVYRRSLLDRLRALANGGETTVVVASHITDGLDEIAEDITFLHDGRVVLQAGADDLMTRWKWILYKEGLLDRAIEERFATCGISRSAAAA